MRIRKYDFNYGRRVLLEKAARGITTAGVLTPLWPLIAKGAVDARYVVDQESKAECFIAGAVEILFAIA